MTKGEFPPGESFERQARERRTDKERIVVLERELESCKARERGYNQREFVWKNLIQVAIDAKFDTTFEEGGKTVAWLPLAKGMLF